jgi:hypothetical protein
MCFVKIVRTLFVLTYGCEPMRSGARIQARSKSETTVVLFTLLWLDLVGGSIHHFISLVIE